MPTLKGPRHPGCAHVTLGNVFLIPLYFLRVHIRTGKGQLLFNVAHLDHLCKISKLISWLQVFPPKTINIVLNGTSCPYDAQETAEAPTSILHHPLPPIPLMLVQAKDQNFKLLVVLSSHQPCGAVQCQGGSNWPGIFRVGWKARKTSCNLQLLLWYNMML